MLTSAFSRTLVPNYPLEWFPWHVLISLHVYGSLNINNYLHSSLDEWLANITAAIQK